MSNGTELALEVALAELPPGARPAGGPPVDAPPSAKVRARLLQGVRRVTIGWGRALPWALSILMLCLGACCLPTRLVGHRGAQYAWNGGAEENSQYCSSQVAEPGATRGAQSGHGRAHMSSE